MTHLIFDSSTLISLSSSCMLNAVGHMFADIGMKGVLPSGVVAESISTPMKFKRFELNAVRIQNGLNEGWLESMKLDEKHQQEVRNVLFLSNNCFEGSKGPLTIIHLGEVEALVSANVIGAKLIGIDERSTRMIIEEPKKLAKFLSKRLHHDVSLNKQYSNELVEKFADISFVRSTELVALAAEKGYLVDEIGTGKKVLEAALYAVKYMGCSVSFQEIDGFLEAKK